MRVANVKNVEAAANAITNALLAKFGITKHVSTTLTHPLPKVQPSSVLYEDLIGGTPAPPRSSPYPDL